MQEAGKDEVTTHDFPFDTAGINYSRRKIMDDAKPIRFCQNVHPNRALIWSGEEWICPECSSMNRCVNHDLFQGFLVGGKYLCLGCAFVPNDFEMDPETEDLLFDGNSLKTGMVVLIESIEVRKPVDDSLNNLPVRFDLAKQFNRWVTVEQIKIESDDDFVKFIGVYENGTKRKFSIPLCYAWYVKKNSMSAEILPEVLSEEDYEIKFRAARNIVNQALRGHDKSGDPWPYTAESDEAAQKIMKELFFKEIDQAIAKELFG